MEKKYSVWVGGIEVNDYYLTLRQAKELKQDFDDFDDVVIRKEVF